MLLVLVLLLLYLLPFPPLLLFLLCFLLPTPLFLFLPLRQHFKNDKTGALSGLLCSEHPSPFLVLTRWLMT